MDLGYYGRTRGAAWLREMNEASRAALEASGAEWIGGSHECGNEFVQGRMPDGTIVSAHCGKIVRRESAADDRARLLGEANLYGAF